MNIYFVQKYISKITKQDIKTFSEAKGLSLSKDEIDTIYYYLKNKYQDFFSGKDKDLLEEIKPKLSSNTYSKLEELYYTYKGKYY